jgi:hypothetical protein
MDYLVVPTIILLVLLLSIVEAFTSYGMMCSPMFKQQRCEIQVIPKISPHLLPSPHVAGAVGAGTASAPALQLCWYVDKITKLPNNQLEI